MRDTLSRVRDWVDRLFPDREVYFRSNGQVTFLRVSQKRQLQGVALFSALLIWGVSTTGVTLLSSSLLAEREEEIERHQREYVSLLAEVGEYQQQYDRIVEGLEENQTVLLSLLEEGGSGKDDALDLVGDGLNLSETERARMVLARDALKERLSSFGDELIEVAEQNELLESQVTSMKVLLEDTKAERAELDQARGKLVRRMDEVEAELASTVEGKKALQSELGELAQNLEQTDSERAALFEERASLQAEIAGLEQHQENADQRIVELNEVVARLQLVQDDSRQARRRLAEERDALQYKVVSLETKLSSYAQRQLDLVAKMTERTLSSIGDFERAMELTGIKLDKLVDRVTDGDLSGTGGPFIPLSSKDPRSDDNFNAALSLLDLQLRRWETLRQLATVLPLAPPLNAYKVNSTFGPRTDPVKNARSHHEGLDMGAPTGTEILAPAPGVVTFAGWNGGYGRFIEVDHGFGIVTRYGHLRKISVEKGDRIGFRQVIGTVGSSGRSTGPHLHYEVRLDDRPLDPDNFLEAGRHLFKG